MLLSMCIRGELNEKSAVVLLGALLLASCSMKGNPSPTLCELKDTIITQLMRRVLTSQGWRMYLNLNIVPIYRRKVLKCLLMSFKKSLKQVIKL